MDRVFIRKGVFETLPPHFSLKRGLFDLIFFPHLGVSDTNGLRFFMIGWGINPNQIVVRLLQCAPCCFRVLLVLHVYHFLC